MLQRLSESIARLSTGWVALAGLIIFVLFTALVLPGQAEQAEAYAGEAGSPDGSFFYTADELYGWAEAYGEAGREAFVRARFTFDIVWPIVFTLFLLTAISWVNKRAFSAGSRWRLTNLVPLLGILFDYLENSATSLVMTRYPATTPGVASAAGVFTMLKWVFVNGSFVLLLVGVVVALWRWVKRRS